MVRNVTDQQHGFGERPHYEENELNVMFERMAVNFLMKKYGTAKFPFLTEDLKTFIEEHVESLDQFANLSHYGLGIEGVTEFQLGGKPKVAICGTLQKFENRQRTTLAHEFGHVHLHAQLFEMRARKRNSITTKADNSANNVDWMEWQASYASSALLVPASYARKVVAPLRRNYSGSGAPPADDPIGEDMILAVSKNFQVSKEAARVRLSILKQIAKPLGTGTLFAFLS